MWSSF